MFLTFFEPPNTLIITLVTNEKFKLAVVRTGNYLDNEFLAEQMTIFRVTLAFNGTPFSKLTVLIQSILARCSEEPDQSFQELCAALATLLFTAKW